MTAVKSCGCRYKDSYYEYCDYLCPKHLNEFILKIFNGQLAIKQMKEKYGWNGV